MNNASMMISAIFERKKEMEEIMNKNAGDENNQDGNTKMKERDQQFKVDPFFLLREVAEMSNLQNLQKNENLLSNEQLMARQNYNNMIQSNFEKQVKDQSFDPNSIQEKMKKLRFVKKEEICNNKDANWFQKLSNIVPSNKNDNQETENKKSKILNMKVGLTQEDERKIQREMIPFFQQKQDELKPEYENLKNIGKELKQLQEQFGVVLKQVPPQATTSFMNRRGSQARQYEQLTNQLRINRFQKQTEKTNEKVLNSLINSGQVSRIEQYNQSKLELNQKTSKITNKYENEVGFQDQNGHKSQLQTEQTATETIPPQLTQIENGEDQLKNTEIISEISSYNRPQEDDRICKQCGYFGCFGTCIQQIGGEHNQENQIALNDQGQAFIKNTYGLIDLTKTEFLFKKRGEVDPNLIENKILDDEEDQSTKAAKQMEQEQIKLAQNNMPIINKSKLQKGKNFQLSKDPAVLKQLKSFKPENNAKMMEKLSPQKNQSILRKDSLKILGKQSRLKENLNEYFSQNIIKSQNSNKYVNQKSNGQQQKQLQNHMISEGYSSSIVAKRSLIKMSRNDDLTYLKLGKSNNNEFHSPSVDINSLKTGIHEDVSINKERLFSCGGVSAKQSQYFSNNQEIQKQMKTSQNFMSKQKNRVIMQGIQNQRLSEVAFEHKKNQKYIQNIRNIKQDERNSSFQNEKVKLFSLNQKQKRNRDGDQYEIKTAQEHSYGTFCFSAGAPQQIDDKFITKNESTDEEVCQGFELKNLTNDFNNKNLRQVNLELKKHKKLQNKQKEDINQDDVEQQNLMKYLKKKNKVLKKQILRQQESSLKIDKEGKIKQIPSLKQLQQIINSQLKLEKQKMSKNQLIKKRGDIEQAYGEDAYNSTNLEKKMSNQRIDSSKKRDGSQGGRTTFQNINISKQDVFSHPQKNECFSQGEYRNINKDHSYKNINAKQDLLKNRMISPTMNQKCSSVSQSDENLSIEQKANFQNSIHQLNFKKIQSNLKTLDLNKNNNKLKIKSKQVVVNENIQILKSGRLKSNRDNKYGTYEFQESRPQNQIDKIKSEIQMNDLQNIQFQSKEPFYSNDQKQIISPISANQSYQELQFKNVEQQNENNSQIKNQNDQQEIGQKQKTMNKDPQADLLFKKQDAGKMIQTEAQTTIRRMNLISENNEQKSIKSQTLGHMTQSKDEECFIKEFEGADILNKNDYKEIIKWQKDKKKFEKIFVQRSNLSNSMVDNSQKQKFSLGKDSQTVAGFLDPVNINYENFNDKKIKQKIVLSQAYSSNQENNLQKEFVQFPKFVKSVKETQRRIESNMVQNFVNVNRVKLSQDNSNLLTEQLQLRQYERFKIKGDQFFKSNENNLNLRSKQLNSNIIKSKSIFPQFTKSLLNPLMHKNSLNQANFDQMKKEKNRNIKKSFAVTTKDHINRMSQFKSPDNMNDLDTMRVARQILSKDIFNDVSILNPMVRNINSQNQKNMQVQRTQLVSPMQMAGSILQPAFAQVIQSQEQLRDGKVQSSLNTIQSVADIYMRASTIVKDKKSTSKMYSQNHSATPSQLHNHKDMFPNSNFNNSQTDKQGLQPKSCLSKQSNKKKLNIQDQFIQECQQASQSEIDCTNESNINKLIAVPLNYQSQIQNQIQETKMQSNQYNLKIFDSNDIHLSNHNNLQLFQVDSEKKQINSIVQTQRGQKDELQNELTKKNQQNHENNQSNSVIINNPDNLKNQNQSQYSVNSNLKQKQDLTDLRLNLNVGLQDSSQMQKKGIIFSKKEFQTESMSQRNQTYKQIFTNNLAQNHLNFSNYGSTEQFKQQNNYDQSSNFNRNLNNQSDYKTQYSHSLKEKKIKESEIALMNNFGKQIIQGQMPLKNQIKDLVILSKKIQVSSKQKRQNQEQFQQETYQLTKKQKKKKSRNDYLQGDFTKSREKIKSQLSQSQGTRFNHDEKVRCSSKKLMKIREQFSHSKLLETNQKNQMFSVDEQKQQCSKREQLQKQLHQLQNLQLRRSCQNIMMIKNQDCGKEPQQKLETLIQQKRSLGQLLSLQQEQNSGRKKYKQSSKKTPLRILSNRNQKNGMEQSNKSHTASNPFQIYTQGLNQQYLHLIKNSGLVQALASQTSLPLSKKKKKMKKLKKKNMEQTSEQNQNEFNYQLKKNIFSSDEATEEEDEEDCQSQQDKQENIQI